MKPQHWIAIASLVATAATAIATVIVREIAEARRRTAEHERWDRDRRLPHYREFLEALDGVVAASRTFWARDKVVAGDWSKPRGPEWEAAALEEETAVRRYRLAGTTLRMFCDANVDAVITRIDRAMFDAQPWTESIGEAPVWEELSEKLGERIKERGLESVDKTYLWEVLSRDHFDDFRRAARAELRIDQPPPTQDDRIGGSGERPSSTLM